MRTMGILKFVPIGVLMAVAISASICGCSSGASTLPSGATPTITSLSPTSTTVGGASFILTVIGSNFVPNSVVRWNGSNRPTAFVNSSQVTAQIPASDIAATVTVSVTVVNSAPGGGSSNGVNFAIQTNPIPTISVMNPTCAPVGAQAFPLAVAGSNFVDSSVVRWNGSDRPTALDASGPLLTAQIPANDLAAAGTAAITVFNPAPGGGSSNTLTLNMVAGGVSPQSVAVDPTGEFAYVANEGCLDAFAGNVSMYKIDPTTGALTPIGPPVAAGLDPHSVAVDPSGKFAYVANAGVDVLPGSVSMYTINATTGALTSIGTLNADQNAPYSVAVHPSGKFVYVANEGGFAPTSVSMYTINPIGALTSTGTIASGGRATSVAVHPSGRFAYVVNGSPGDSVSVYTINTTTGALTSKGTAGAGSSPTAIAIDPSGNFAYVVNSNSNDVSMYTVDAATGILMSVGLVAAGTNPSSVAVDPTGKFAYVTNSGSNAVSTYSIDAGTGTLTLTGTIGT